MRGGVFTVLERGRGAQRGGVRHSAASSTRIPRQPIRGQAALQAANQSRGLAVWVLLEPQTVTAGTDYGVSGTGDGAQGHALHSAPVFSGGFWVWTH